MEDKIYGRNPVIEALSGDREIDKIFFQDGLTHSLISKITAMAKEKRIPYKFVNRKKLDELAEGGNHQGVVAFVAMQSYATVEDILERAKEKGEPPFILIADGLSDPHNLGSIIRTANAAGMHGIIIPKNRSVSLNAVVAKVSAGAIEHIPVAKVANIAQTIEKLKKEGVWVAGTDLSASRYHYDADLKGPLAIVIGSEGEGIGRLVKEKCDFLVKIPMIGEIESLNASVAAGVLIYEAIRQRS
ncbi:MAG: 23S rRNA (guanosine(2251)-2'-O)-methyltransferase RlmB [Clostridia bacterium]|nr:23S rRNA (guanosine(2251)-2'-O)-methyltransferase RlmB [Clostridia bacterium]